MTRQDHGSGVELGRFLRARRARVAPADVGLAPGPGLRRTPGLRREELAGLAGISIDYYIRLERGRETRPSTPVIDALARALLLDEQEHEHLRDLAARAARPPLSPPRAPDRTLPPGVGQLLESLRPNPAYVLGRTGDLLAWNPGGLRLLAGIDDWPAERRNTIRHLFLHPAARELYEHWDDQLRGCVARLRALAGIEPDAPDVVGLIDELRDASPEFARLWEYYDIKGRAHGRKSYRHPDVGRLTLGYQGMELAGTPGHRLVAYHAEPGTPDHDAMVLLDLAPAEHPAR
ncbi:helix-turn-helix transcriptional regulator [Saccharopolyspora rosea]|uniref:Helix-turn-helix transcriptional regulator n=1 Tax=Saccharopolyspora rosea TaxID=524884 RepID=A0ABW3FRZ5_9PSEU|nr:helix-turn-helix transcriptional regulator [Saccharopolyspora rosea]